MHDSGRIYRTNDEETARRKGLHPLTEKEAKVLGRMNRHDRRAWLARERQAARVHANMGRVT